MKYRNILIILLLCMGIYSYAQGEEIIRSGLYFSSHEVVQDKRTSLHLTPEKPFHFKKNFSVEFDARFREGDGYYGLIFRIIANENTNIDLISNLGAEGSNFWLVIKDEILFSFDFDEIPNSDFGNWITVATDVNIEKSTISVSFNDVKKERKIEEISALNKFDIVFGACSNPKFLNTDVSPMTLNNVQIYNNDKLYRHWKLSKHGFDAVYDEIKNEKGIVKNGIWLIDSHLKWEKQLSDNVVGLTGLCRDEEKGIVYLIAKDFMLSYNLITSKIDTIKYKEGHPFNNYYDCFIYNRQTNRIISYDLPEKLINEFDFETQTWQHNDFAYKEPDFAHHNKIISTNGDLITFGGYGHYKYKGVINVYDEKENTWNSENVSKGIYPRYMSAAGLSENNQWLILGGYGSKSGRQEISPEFFYDLHSIDLNTFEVKKINEYKTPEIPFVPCGTLIKTDSDSFLTLIYNSGNFNSFLQLAEFSINTPDYFLFPDSIPYNFSDIASWCMFFLHHESSRMVAVTVNKTDVQLYTMSYPPLQESEVYQTSSRSKSSRIWLLLGFFAVCGIIALIVFKKRKKEENIVVIAQETEPPLVPDTEQKAEVEVVVPENDAKQVNINFEIPKRESTSSIYFLGGFQVFDKEGNDITSSFTPTLKQLFIIIMLYMVKNGRGISTAKLNETLWFDKTETSARNNRNVSISKLRNLLDKVGEIDIEQESAYWRVKMDGIYSDYLEVTSLYKKLESKKADSSDEDAMRFIQIVSQGELLPNVQTDWIDDFKADFSNMVIDTLLKISSAPHIQQNNQLLSFIADAIFKYDSINEDAIGIKCMALYRLGKKGLAKTAYDSFVREYKNLLGSDYSVSFNELISNSSAQ